MSALTFYGHSLFLCCASRDSCHGSDGAEGAAHEINFWFRADELNDWQSIRAPWTYEKP